MIKNISEKLSRLKAEENRILLNNSVSSSKYDKQNPAIQEKTGDTYTRHSNSNPFEQRKKNESNIQKYFDDKYYKINLKIKEIISRLSSKNGDINDFINTGIIDASVLVSKYLYDKSFNLNNYDKRTYDLSEENDYLKVTFEDFEGKTSISFDKHSLLRIDKKSKTSTDSIIFRKQNYFEKLFSINKNSVEKYEKRDLFNNLIEEVSYTKDKKPEKYVKYRLNKKEYEIIFDTSDWQVLKNTGTENQNIIPLEYLKYDFCETLVTKLLFQYAKPHKYMEFNSNTGKATKIFNLQGLSSIVAKYSFYNSLNGQVLVFGTL